MIRNGQEKANNLIFDLIIDSVLQHEASRMPKVHTQLYRVCYRQQELMVLLLFTILYMIIMILISLKEKNLDIRI